jgi:putative flippase GtrA
MRVLSLLPRRQLLFLGVGGSCFAVQYGLLTLLATGGLYRPLANALGFLTSAQLNFLLSSRLTWSDRHAVVSRTVWARLASYNATALISLAINTVVFQLAYQRLGNLAAAAAGVVAGLCVTYAVCDRVIFRKRARHQSGHRAAPKPDYQSAHRVTNAAARDQGSPIPSWSAS